MDFPGYVSYTITNACNLRCTMCGQWSEHGYVRGGRRKAQPAMRLADWKRIVDEAESHGVSSVLLRGGEPFLYPHIVELLDHLANKGLFTSIDSNGTLLARYASDLVRIGKVHVTVSIDGPEEIHDRVRGVTGCFARIREGLAALRAAEEKRGTTISKSLTFTISPHSLLGLGALPGVARSLGVPSVCIVPYYWVTTEVGERYEQEMKDRLGCVPFSWRGFQHDHSGVDGDAFGEQYRIFLETLGDLTNYPYMPLTEEQYRVWFADATTPVGSDRCPNAERLIDVQPDGEANCCVDFPDYSFGNVRQATLSELWNGERARRFRDGRQREPFAVCRRCGAKHMAEIRA